MLIKKPIYHFGPLLLVVQASQISYVACSSLIMTLDEGGSLKVVVYLFVDLLNLLIIIITTSLNAAHGREQ